MLRDSRIFLLVLIAFLSLATRVDGQSPVTVDKLPPPPPVPKLKPTPTPLPPKSEEIDIVRVTSNLVVVPVSVTDATGQPTLGLSAADFRLEEQGRPQEIAQIGDPEQVPLDIALLLDVSGSVEARFDFERESASRFLREVLKAGDRAAIYTIDQEPRLEQILDTAARTTKKLMAINSAKGATAFYDAVIDAARYLARSSPPEHRRVILVISDGEDNFSEKIKKAIGNTQELQNSATPEARRWIYDRMVAETQKELQKADTTFYSINPSGPGLRLNVISQRAQDSMEQLATSTGGTSFVPDRLDDLDAVFRRITSELRSQYLLQYYSKSEAPSGTFLSIGVQVPKRSAQKIRARQGYYVKRK
jgi:Ca-activated chloride channel family protein